MGAKVPLFLHWARPFRTSEQCLFLFSLELFKSHSFDSELLKFL
jgi:hypothetical protein